MFIVNHTATSFPFFSFNDTATTEIYTLSLHDALPICKQDDVPFRRYPLKFVRVDVAVGGVRPAVDLENQRSEEHSLNSSHVKISYAVFCLKKKKRKNSKKSEYHNTVRHSWSSMCSLAF